MKKGLISNLLGMLGATKLSKDEIGELLNDAAKTYAETQDELDRKQREEEDAKWEERNEKLNEKYMFDFKPKWTGYTSNPKDEDGNEIKKIAVKPIDVVEELGNLPNPFSMENLDDKIEMMRDKEELIQQHYAKKEVTGLRQRLENRKKYDEFKDFFGEFQTTNHEKIDQLLNKYELVMKESDIFIPDFPKEAIDKMKEYDAKCEELCGMKPKYYVIAEDKDFKKAYEKRDPILLAQSPFGFYYDILGAWDKEMLILGEL